MKKTLLLLFLYVPCVFAQDLPERPSPPRLVNDFASFLPAADANRMESDLVSFSNRTGTQIAVVTVPSLNGYEAGDYATRLAQKWQIGQKGKDNGVLLLIKPRINNEPGKVFIATGYGMEDILPDVVCKRIIENEMIPRFRHGQNTEAIEQAISIIKSLAEKKFTPEQYIAQSVDEAPPLPVVVLLFVIIFFIIGLISRVSRFRNRSIGHSLPWWIAAGMLSGMGRNSGWSHFSSGSGSFSGFGGGSFGGGGAGGSW